MSKRDRRTTPMPQGFKYVRAALPMPVAVKGLVRRGRVVGKGEESAEGSEMEKQNVSMQEKAEGEGKPKHSHMVWHITEPTGPGVSRAHANVSARNEPEAVNEAKRIFPHLKEKSLQADVVSSTAHTPPHWPLSYHHELEHNQDPVKKNDEGIEQANKALWNHQRGVTPKAALAPTPAPVAAPSVPHAAAPAAGSFPMMGRDKALAGKQDAAAPKTANPTPKKPASMIDMKWMKDQKSKLAQKSEDTDVAGLLWLFCTEEGHQELAKMTQKEDKTPAFIDSTNEALLKHQLGFFDKIEPLNKSESTHIARWESSSGKDWVDLHDHGDGSYSYNAPSAGGHLGKLPSRDHAISQMQTKVDSGYFLPDKAKRPMKRVK